jgi:uncharacterized protein (DUF362 family)/Pyruvate/2-oxoacid:ferredoxin oxidoreductase delta subunit
MINAKGQENHKKSKVALLRCGSYDLEKVYSAIKNGLDMIGGLRRIVHPGHTVLLKVNLIGAWHPDRAITTHPAVVEALCLLIKEAGGRPVIGDSSGGSAYGKTAKALDISGMASVAKKTGAALANFDEAEIVKVKGSLRATALVHIAKPLVDADVIISVPKLKTHTGTFITGSVKNMFGSIPGGRKAEFHRTAPSMKSFTEVLIDIFSLVKPALTVIDGIVGMDGNGPSAGNPKPAGVILISEDCVAADTVMAAICGIKPEIVDTLTVAKKRGLGNGSLADIEVVGTPLEQSFIPNFKLPLTIGLAKNRWIPRWFKEFVSDRLPSITSPRPMVKKKMCTKCGTCVKSCPAKAMKLMVDAPKIDYTRCISCFCCHELCPKSAFEIKVHWLWRVSRL